MEINVPANPSFFNMVTDFHTSNKLLTLSELPRVFCFFHPLTRRVIRLVLLLLLDFERNILNCLIMWPDVMCLFCHALLLCTGAQTFYDRLLPINVKHHTNALAVV